MNARNHIVDDPRNSLVARMVRFVAEFRPKIFLLENARELRQGRFRQHFRSLREGLEALGYSVSGSVHMLTRFGLPQARERTLVIAVSSDLPLRTLEDLWSGYRVADAATHVRRAIAELPPVEPGKAHPSDPAHVSSTVSDVKSVRRLMAIPRDGGSWSNLLGRPDADDLLIGTMKRAVERGRLNQFCDIYGRMAWDRPAPTIKRECSHVGNGRYTHPEQHRICSVREMALLQGFPKDYKLVSRSRKNMYRQVGDAVPPLISYQLAMLCEWILTDRRPALDSLILRGTHLRPGDIRPADESLDLFASTRCA
jgi:DNA (cytosine-5)-methyltransferase 1